MSIFVTLFHMFATAYRLVVTLWNACIVFFQLMKSLMQEVKQEATEVMALLDDGTPIMDALASTSLLLDASGLANTQQMLIIARVSSFVLLLRLSKHRVLHLEVDEKFIAAKLEVIRTELTLYIQHVPRLLQMPIGTHDTRLIKYTPMKLPYLWKEEQIGPRCGDGVAKKSIVPTTPAFPVGAGSEGRTSRKKYVQLLTEGALRRRLRMDRVERVGSKTVPKKGMGVAKSHGENLLRRKALANATNMGSMHAEGSTDTDGMPDETRGSEAGVVDTPKQVRMERSIHAALSENLSIPNMAQAAPMRKVVESAQQTRQTSSQSLRRKRGHLDLYTKGVHSEFSLLPKASQGRN